MSGLATPSGSGPGSEQSSAAQSKPLARWEEIIVYQSYSIKSLDMSSDFYKGAHPATSQPHNITSSSKWILYKKHSWDLFEALLLYPIKALS